MKNRLKLLRNKLKLTQKIFAEKIGSTQNTLANYEIGKRNPSSSVINNICKTFNVNETWLRTGEGEMFLPQPNDEVSALAKQFNISAGMQTLIRKIIELPQDAQETVVQLILDTAQAITDSDTSQETESQSTDELQDTLEYPLDPKTATKEEKLKEYEAYLDAKEEAEEKSSVSNL